MSRVAKNPVVIANGVEVKIDGQSVMAKGPKGSGTVDIHSNVQVSLEEGKLQLSPVSNADWPMAGTKFCCDEARLSCRSYN